MKNTCSLLILCLTMASCATSLPGVAERDVASRLEIPEQWQAQPSSASALIDGLKGLFDDQQLNALVEQILSNNLELQRAYYQIEEAGFSLEVQRSSFFPGLSSSFTGNRSDNPDGSSASRTYSGSLDASWELDLWGKVRSQYDSAQATAQARIEDYKAMQDSLAAQGIQLWFDLVSNNQQVSLSNLRVQNLHLRKADTLDRYQAGLAELDDVVAIEREIAITQASLQQQLDTLNQSIRALKILSGQYPDTELDTQYQLPSLLDAPHPNLPANVITSRPDLKAAWQQVIAADASVSVAQKQLYPSLTLSGVLSKNNDSLSDVFGGTSLLSIAGQALVPLFNAGKLRNSVYEQQSRAEQAWVGYLLAVQNAFDEAEGALDRETLFRDREERLSEALIFAQQTEQIAANRYQNGLISILEYLDAQDTRFAVQGDLISARNNRLQNRVALALALGAGI